MRLSCEKLPVLLTCLAAHLVWGEALPPAARALVGFNARISTAFQRVSGGRAGAERVALCPPFLGPQLPTASAPV
jgi:hypothetical protein